MNLRQLGNSDMHITPIGIGTWAMGGGQWEWSWGPQNDSDSMHAIYEGLESGLNRMILRRSMGLGVRKQLLDIDNRAHCPPFGGRLAQA
jgi:hypothetical protein